MGLSFAWICDLNSIPPTAMTTLRRYLKGDAQNVPKPDKKGRANRQLQPGQALTANGRGERSIRWRSPMEEVTNRCSTSFDGYTNQANLKAKFAANHHQC
jgi:hypothetical protein